MLNEEYKCECSNCLEEKARDIYAWKMTLHQQVATREGSTKEEVV